MSDYVAWLRRQVGPHLVPLMYATAIIRDEGGRILFQRRADFGETWWGLPGGLLEPGETPEACLRREVEQETGLLVEPVRLTGVYSSPRYNVAYPNGDRVQQITQCYACTIGGGEYKPDGREILELRYFSTEAPPPHPLWYADMVQHALADLPSPYFDLPEHVKADTPYPTLMSLRRATGSAPVLWPTSVAVVVDEARVLLRQRRGNNGLWGPPVGVLAVGETLAHTAIRATLEQTGLRVEPVRLLTSPACDEIVCPVSDRVFPISHWFTCRIVGGQLRADGREVTEVGFFRSGNLPPLFPATRQVIRPMLVDTSAIHL